MSDVLTRIAAVEKLLLEVQNQVSQASDRATTRQLFLLLENAIDELRSRLDDLELRITVLESRLT